MLLPRHVRLAHRDLDFRPHGRTQKQIDQLGVELRSFSFGDRVGGFLEASGVAVAAAVCDRVEAVRDRDDASR
jgi:hypothetical protein